MNDRNELVAFIIDRVKKKMYVTGDTRVSLSNSFKRDYRHVCGTLTGRTSCGIEVLLQYCDYLGLDVLKAIKKELMSEGALGDTQVSYNDRDD